MPSVIAAVLAVLLQWIVGVGLFVGVLYVLDADEAVDFVRWVIRR